MALLSSHCRERKEKKKLVKFPFRFRSISLWRFFFLLSSCSHRATLVLSWRRNMIICTQVVCHPSNAALTHIVCSTVTRKEKAPNKRTFFCMNGYYTSFSHLLFFSTPNCNESTMLTARLQDVRLTSVHCCCSRLKIIIAQQKPHRQFCSSKEIENGDKRHRTQTHSNRKLT